MSIAYIAAPGDRHVLRTVNITYVLLHDHQASIGRERSRPIPGNLNVLRLASGPSQLGLVTAVVNETTSPATAFSA